MKNYKIKVSMTVEKLVEVEAYTAEQALITANEMLVEQCECDGYVSDIIELNSLVLNTADEDDVVTVGDILGEYLSRQEHRAKGDILAFTIRA